LLNYAKTLYGAQSAPFHFAQSITGKETVAPSKEEAAITYFPSSYKY
jgi:hypothetical protein